MYEAGFQIRGKGFSGVSAGSYGSYGHGGYAGDLITAAYTIANPALVRSGRFRAVARAPSDCYHAYKINSIDPEGTGDVKRNRDEPRARRIAIELEKQVYRTVSTVCLCSCLWI